MLNRKLRKPFVLQYEDFQDEPIMYLGLIKYIYKINTFAIKFWSSS